MSANPHNESPLAASPAARINYRADEHDVDYIPAVDTPAGTVVVFGDGIGVTKLDIPAGQLGVLHLDGQWDFPKVAATAFAWGDELAWDAGTTAADGEAGAMIAASGTIHAICCQPEGAGAGTNTVRARLV